MSALSRNICIALVPLACVAVIAAAPAQDGDESDVPAEQQHVERGSSRQRGESDAFAGRYGVLLENNIFLRDRRPQRPPATSQATRPAPPPRPEKDWVLVGVVFEEGAFRAYFENVRGSGVTRAVVGDPIATGAITGVYIDAVAYLLDGEVAWIEIGQDLTGEYVVIPGAAVRPTTVPTTSAAGAPPAGAPDPNALSIEERLRQRRLQESAGRSATPPGTPAERPAGDPTPLPHEPGVEPAPQPARQPDRGPPN